MKSLPLAAAVSFVASIVLCASTLAAEPGKLVPGEPVLLDGTHGRFDFIQVDQTNRRLVAAHTGNQTLDVIDLDKKRLLKAVKTGAAQSVAIDEKAKAYYVAVSNPPQLAIVDAGTLEVKGTVPLSGPADLAALNASTGLVYVGHDDAKEVWVVDPARKKITATIELPGEAPEDIWVDAPAGRAYQAVKAANLVAVIDTKTNAVVGKWPTAPAEGPHGMALVNEAAELAIAGGNGKLALIRLKDGHLVTSAEIAKGVDQVAYDAALHRIYCASNTGKINVFSVDGENLTSRGEVVSAPGAKSIAVDAKTHTVWVAYAKGDASFVQPFVYEAEAK